MPNHKNSAPFRIGKVIGSIIREAEGKEAHKPDAMALVAFWPEAAGDKHSKVSRAVSLADGKLFVEVNAPAWKQELLIVKKDLIRKVNARMGKNLVYDIVFNVRDYADGRR